MKASKLLMVAVLALVLPGLGCNKANKVVVETKTAPTDAVLLQVKWPLGRNAIQSMDMKQSMQLTVPNMPQPMTNDMTMGQSCTLTVIQASDTNKLALQMEYRSTKMEIITGGKSMMSYDSAHPQGGDANPAAAIFGKLVGAKVSFVLDASNRVESVEGADELAQRIAASSKIDPAGTLKSMFGADLLKQSLDFAAKLPSGPVKPGDTWPVHNEFAMGSMGTMVMDYTYTLDSWEKRHDRYCAKIEMDGTLIIKGGDSAGVNGMKFVIHDGKTSGETWFDRDLGMFTDTKIYLDMKMDITVPNPMARRKPTLPKTMTIPSTISQTITTKFELQ